jgi:chemotaxis response regulator CheB
VSDAREGAASRRALRVVLVDDSPLLLRRLATLLVATGRVEIVAMAPDIDAGLREEARCRPDVVVVGFSNFGWQAMRRTWLDAGAAAYFDKSLQIEEIRRWMLARADGMPAA